MSTIHHTQSVPSFVNNERYDLYHNHPIQTMAEIRHNKPDLVLLDKEHKIALIVEVAISWYTRLEMQSELKRNRYVVNGNYEDDLNLPYPEGDSVVSDLSARGWKVDFCPIIIGATGEISEKSRLQFDKIGLSESDTNTCIERMSRSAVLGSNRIIKQHLASK